MDQYRFLGKTYYFGRTYAISDQCSPETWIDPHAHADFNPPSRVACSPVVSSQNCDSNNPGCTMMTAIAYMILKRLHLNWSLEYSSEQLSLYSFAECGRRLPRKRTAAWTRFPRGTEAGYRRKRRRFSQGTCFSGQLTSHWWMAITLGAWAHMYMAT